MPLEDKNLFNFKFPSNKNPSFSIETVLYSFYLKTLGVDQTLKYGDWYYNCDGDLSEIMVYSVKKDYDNYDDFKLLSDGNYVRIISQEEGLNILRTMGYKYTTEGQPIIISDDGQTNVSFDNDIGKVGITTTATSCHAAHLKAAYLVSAQTKIVMDANNTLSKTNFFKIHKEGE